MYFFLYFVYPFKFPIVTKLLHKLKSIKNLQKTVKTTKNTNNYLLEKLIDVRESDKVAYINLFRVVVPELFLDDDTRRENFRIIMR